MEQGRVKRSGRGRPRIRPLRLVGDKGYTGRRIRNYLRRRGRASNNPTTLALFHGVVRLIVKSTVNVILLNVPLIDAQQFRRIATRYEKLAANYTAMPSDRLHFVMVIV